jgi:DNA-binding cell septation regulator SpoVG
MTLREKILFRIDHCSEVVKSSLESNDFETASVFDKVRSELKYLLENNPPEDLKITNIWVYPSEKDEDELAWCSVAINNGLTLNAVNIYQEGDSLVVRFPAYNMAGEDEEERLGRFYNLSEDLEREIKERVLEKFKREWK